jgi:hypothetical protein
MLTTVITTEPMNQEDPVVPMMRVQVNSGPWENVRDTEAAAIIADAYRTGARGVHVRLLDQYPLLHGRPLTPCEYRELLEQVRAHRADQEQQAA